MARLKIKLDGFEDMLRDIQKAGKDVDKAAKDTIKQSAKVYEQELKSAAKSSGVPDHIVNEVKAETKVENDRYSAKVGWSLGTYDPTNLSAGYKAMFINYGTVRRQTKKGYNRGEIPKPTNSARFTTKAKRKANVKIKRLQQDIINKVQEDIK